uniref:N(4)-(Beta-N-acetylglucosaminyl)-L-asparaginase- like n=1 Tax=Geotrypetes seraphini TaxID=260995 RepID=A0A6P8PP79_GEOSA|nr:N(4)-(Beta-N-acetylglucosaminyl)-L-asparaginase-like [Geotrypetes seraphini]
MKIKGNTLKISELSQNYEILSLRLRNRTNPLMNESAGCKNMGFPADDLTANKSLSICPTWLNQNCQPNFWKNVVPDTSKFCGPYRLHKMRKKISWRQSRKWNFPPTILSVNNHDTSGMIVIEGVGNIADGTFTNGATHKIPGRVGDSLIATAYADSTCGSPASTGDGDIMMSLSSYQAVEYVRTGSDPTTACQKVISQIQQYIPVFFSTVVCANAAGSDGAACCKAPGLTRFHDVVYNSLLQRAMASM